MRRSMPRSWLSALVISAIMLVLFVISTLEKAPQSEALLCAPTRKAGGYCSASLLHDGYIRFSVISSNLQHCCSVTRDNVDQNRIDYKVEVCAADKAMDIDCSKFQYPKSYKDSFFIDGQLLTNPYLEN